MEEQKPTRGVKRAPDTIRTLHCLAFSALVTLTSGVGCRSSTVSGSKVEGTKMVERSPKSKVEGIKVATRFVECFYRNDVACLRETTNWNESDLAAAKDKAAKTVATIGRRVTGVPNQNSWAYVTETDEAGTPRMTFTMTGSAVYERDANVQEHYVLIEFGARRGVESFIVMSRKFDTRTQHTSRPWTDRLHDWLRSVHSD